MKKTVFPFLLFFMSVSVFAQNAMPLATTGTGGILTVTYAVSAPGTQTHYAVYITNSLGQLVNTLGYAYSDVGGYADQLISMYSFTGNTINSTTLKYVGSQPALDGFTSATISTAQTSKTVYWGKTGTMATNVAALADGNYTVNFELVKRNNNRTKTSATFVKGPAISTPTVFSPAITTFNSISVSWVPASTAIKSVELEKMYSVSPNPLKSSFSVNGPDILTIELFTIAGKRIKSTTETKMNIGTLAKGNYIAIVTTKSGKLSKKIVKE